MLRAASLIRPVLASRPAVASSACPFSRLRITADSARVQTTSLLWKQPAAMAAGVRCMMTDSSQRTASPTVEAALRAKDKLPPEYTIIYRAPLQNYIYVTYFAAWVSIVSVPLIIASMYFGTGDQTYPYELGGVPIIENSTDSYIVTIMLLVTIANIAHTVSKYPYRIYRNPKENKYVAVFQHLLPGLTIKKEFVAGEVRKVNSFFWKDSCFAIKKKKMLIIPDNFSTPIELERMQIDPKLNDPAEIRKRRSKMV